MSRIMNLICVLIFIITLLGKTYGNLCGSVEFIDPKIVGGTQTTRGAWPFIVALYYTENSKFFCGGSLISSKNVLTAAHCVQQKNSAQKLLPEDVIALLGAYNLDVKLERGAQQRSVEKIFVHPDWKVFSDKFDADLAVFVLDELVEFTKFIRPICLPNDNAVINGVEGFIVGWGLAENTKIDKHEAIPRQAVTNSLNDTFCFTTNHLVASISSSRTFCGGGEINGNSASPNKGDSGGGFFVLSQSVWVQYGIISAAISDSTGRVNANSISVYTNVRLFRSWIEEIVRSSGASTQMLANNNEQFEFHCTYDIIDQNYRCTLRDLNITEDNRAVTGFSGSHISGHSSQDVTEIWFWTGKSVFLPNGMGNLFTNLEKLLVSDDNRNLGLKAISRTNFKNMQKLKYINLRSNELDTIDEDSLHELPLLTTFIIKKNKIRMLHRNTFARNPKLVRVDVMSNELEYLHGDLFKSNLLLQEAQFSDNKLTKIYIDFTQFKHIKKIDFRTNVCINQSLNEVRSLAEFQTLIRYHCDEFFTTV